MTQGRGGVGRSPRARSRRALAVVIVVAASLAACGLPSLRDFVERSRAASAFNFLASVRTAQKRHHGRVGRYAADLASLDVRLELPESFAGGTVAARHGSLDAGWTLTLTRSRTLWGRGGYTVTFNEDGFDKDPSRSSILRESDSIHPVERATTRQWSP